MKHLKPKFGSDKTLEGTLHSYHLMRVYSVCVKLNYQKNYELQKKFQILTKLERIMFL